LIDVFNEKLIEEDLAISDGIILGSGKYEGEVEIDLQGKIISPGFIDAHLHLESAMTEVSEFARVIIPRGTTTIVADPHELANVAGLAGIRYFLKRGLNQPWNFHLMLPSCVPATSFENSGATLTATDLLKLLPEEGIFGLGEVMDYPSVIDGNPVIWDKIEMIGDRFKDGHAPGLKDKDLNAYLLAGIAADHECTTVNEALEKVQKGMYVMIREGSVTRDLKNLLPAVNDSNCSRFLFATDDRHPGDLLQEGHIDFVIKKAVRYGLSPLRAIRMATLNAALALGKNDLGAIAPGLKADLLVINDLADLTIESVYKDGKLVADAGNLLSYGENSSKLEDELDEKSKNNIFDSINIGKISTDSFKIPAGRKYRVIELKEDQIVTGESIYDTKNWSDEQVPREPLLPELIGHHLVKLAVVERHQATGNIGIGLLHGFGLRKGAVATSIGHDSHNIIVAGLKAKDMYLAVDRIKEMKGGIVVVVDGKVEEELALPIGGLMATKPMKEVAEKLKIMRNLLSSLGVTRSGPFMTLSFLALPVIPSLKLTDEGLFNVDSFQHVPLVLDD